MLKWKIIRRWQHFFLLHREFSIFTLFPDAVHPQQPQHLATEFIIFTSDSGKGELEGERRLRLKAFFSGLLSSSFRTHQKEHRDISISSLCIHSLKQHSTALWHSTNYDSKQRAASVAALKSHQKREQKNTAICAIQESEQCGFHSHFPSLFLFFWRGKSSWTRSTMERENVYHRM